MFIRFNRPEFLTTRYWKHWWQRRVRGWDSSDTWSLDWTMAKFILPRLKLFKEVNNGTPYGFTEESWDETLDKMIFAMEVVANGVWVLSDYEPRDVEEDKIYWEKVQTGLDLFGKYFLHLWW